MDVLMCSFFLRKYVLGKLGYKEKDICLKLEIFRLKFGFLFNIRLYLGSRVMYLIVSFFF